MWHFVLVALGGALGAVLRLTAAKLIPLYVGTGFPWATFFVNTVGCLMIGVVIGCEGERVPAGYSFVAIGLLGALTTFSTFSAETVRLIKDGQIMLAALNSFGTLAICLCATGLGIWAAERFRGV